MGDGGTETFSRPARILLAQHLAAYWPIGPNAFSRRSICPPRAEFYKVFQRNFFSRNKRAKEIKRLLEEEEAKGRWGIVKSEIEELQRMTKTQAKRVPKRAKPARAKS